MDPASFRDPSGFVFRRDGTLYRQVQPTAAADWTAFTTGGLYQRLLADGLVVEHTDVGLEHAALPGAAAVIRPKPIDLISYPYEWSFSQLKEAALLTLELQSRALDAGMRLKDASAYNVQFVDGRPILMDSLSFEVAAARRLVNRWQFMASYTATKRNEPLPANAGSGTTIMLNA